MGTGFDNEAKAEEQPKNVVDFSSIKISDVDVTSKDMGLDDSLTAVNEFDDEGCECILPK